MKESAPKRDWFRILSPAVLGMAFSIVGIIVSYTGMKETGGWSFIGVIAFVPVLVILLVLDIIVKLTFKEKTLFIWLVELLVMALIYAFWISRFTG